MCPCFNVKEWWNNVLAEEESIEPTEESEEVVLEEPVVESGETVVPGEEGSTEYNFEGNCRRPSLLDFVIQILTKLFAYVFRRH